MADHLHHLIRSMSKSEKRYFKLFCSRESGGDNYLKLFNAIGKQSSYDESSIKEAFRAEKFVRQIHVTKNYLRKLILKSLRNYHAGISKDAELKDTLRNVEILYNKELYSLATMELKRAERIATHHELLNGKVEIETWKRKLAQVESPHGYAAFQETLASQQEAIHALQQTNSHWQTAVNVSARMFSQRDQNVSVRNVRLKKPDTAQTLETNVLFHNTQYLLDLQNEDPKAAEHQLTSLIALLEEHPTRIQEDPGLYVSTINNLLSFYVYQQRTREAMQLIQKTKEVYDNWKITAANRTLLKQILRTYNIELEIYRNTKSFKQQRGIIESTEAFIQANVQKIPKDYLLSFWFQLASIYFMWKQYSAALDWINKVLNARFKNAGKDLIIHTHLLNLMIHLEQHNHMVLRYYVDSARRYIRKVHAMQPYLDILLRFFVKMSRMPLSAHHKAFRQLKGKLFPGDQESLIPEALTGYIDIPLWISERV